LGLTHSAIDNLRRNATDEEEEILTLAEGAEPEKGY
jgi:hypothetical protein